MSASKAGSAPRVGHVGVRLAKEVVAHKYINLFAEIPDLCLELRLAYGDDGGVPRISEFYGIVITMYAREHGVPHFHANYAGTAASVAIESGEVLSGRIPDRALRLVKEWAKTHKFELLVNWELLRRGDPPRRIEPLR